MKTISYLNEVEEQIESLLIEVHSKCEYSTYDTLFDLIGILLTEIDELHKEIENKVSKTVDK